MPLERDARKSFCRKLACSAKQALARKEDKTALLLIRGIAWLLPRDLPTHVWLSNVYERSGNLRAAIKTCRYACQLTDADDGTFSRLSYLYIRARMYTQAIDAAEKAVRLNEENGYSYYCLGFSALMSGDEVLAERSFCDCILVDPDNSGAYYTLGRLLYKQGRLQLAEEYIAHAAALPGANYGILFSLSQIYWSLDRLEEARECLQRVLIMVPRYGPAYELTGKVLERLGKQDEADLAFLTAVRLKPSV